MMARCILHVGTHKTGTTTVQTILKQKQNELRLNGFYYPLFKGNINHNHLAHKLATCSDSELTDIRLTLNHSIGSLDNETDCLVLSAEEFSTRICHEKPWMDLDSNYEDKRLHYLGRLKRVLSDFERIDIYICFRSHEEYAHSLYATKILSQKVDTSFVNFVKDSFPIFNYQLQKSLFQSLGTTHERSYEMMNGNLENEFFSWLGLPVGVVVHDRLRQTPPVELIYWLAQKVQLGIDKYEWHSRVEFCRSFIAKNASIEFKAESLWETSKERDAFMRSCIGTHGNVNQTRARQTNPEALRDNLSKLDELYSFWRSKRRLSKFKRFFQFLK